RSVRTRGAVGSHSDKLSPRRSPPFSARSIGAVAERPSRHRPLHVQLDYAFDRLRATKLAHAYELLVPTRARPLGVATRKPGARWERSMVWAMLRNPAYRGAACFGKTRVATRQRVTRPLRMRGGMATRDSANHERPREEWIEIPVPARLEQHAFDRAQELLQENKV